MPDLARGKDLGVVFKTYECIALTEVAGLTERLPQRVERRIEVQHDQSDDGRSDKTQRPYGFSLLRLCRLLFRRFLFHKFPPLSEL